MSIFNEENLKLYTGKAKKFARVELFQNLVCHLFLQEKKTAEIIIEIERATGRVLTPYQVTKFISDATKSWIAKKSVWAENITFVELEKINRIEAEAWTAYYKSCQTIKTVRRKYKPIKTKSGRKPKDQSMELVEEVIEERESIPDVKFLLIADQCSKRRLEILGHSSPLPPKIEDGSEPTEEVSPVAGNSIRTLEVVSKDGKKISEITTTIHNEDETQSQ